MHQQYEAYLPIDMIPRTPVGRRLEKMRLERCLSQRSLAAKAGLNRDTISRLEAGLTYYPQWQTLECIAEAFGMNVIELQRELGMEGKGRDLVPAPPPKHYSRIAAKIADMVEKMTPRQQSYVEGLCMQLVAKRGAAPGELPKR